MSRKRNKRPIRVIPTSQKTYKRLTADEAGLVRNLNQRIPTVTADQVQVSGTEPLTYGVISDKTVTLDQALAARYIDLPVFEGEREVTDTHVQFLYDQMRRRLFNPLLVILSTAVYEGVEYKINGQHTCWAVQYMPAGFSIQVREIRYSVATPEQLRLLYSTYDRMRVRSDGHCTKVQLAGTAVMEGLHLRIVNQLVSSLKFWYFEASRDRNRVTPEQVAVVIQNEIPDLFRKVAQYAQTHQDFKHVRRAPVLAAVFATYDKVPTIAPQFWEPVATGVDLTKATDPRLRLRDLLMQSATNKSYGQQSKDFVHPEAMYRICIGAWNRWRKGEPVRVLRMTKERVAPV
jgi:hypothetical protein